MSVVHTSIPQRQIISKTLPYTRDRAGLEAAFVERAIEDHGGFPKLPFTFIYFVQGVAGGPIKIGNARDPIKRRTDLQIGSPVILRLTRAIVALRGEEQRLHALFAAVRMHGEWFEPHPVLADIADAIPDPSLADAPCVVAAL